MTNIFYRSVWFSICIVVIFFENILINKKRLHGLEPYLIKTINSIPNMLFSQYSEQEVVYILLSLIDFLFR